MLYIKHYRKLAGYTQEYVAYNFPVSLSTYKRWEKGKTEPRTSDIKRLCEMFGCTESELLNGPKSKEISVKVKIGNIEEVNDMTINLGNADGFGMILDTRGAVGVAGAATFDFESDTELEGVITKIGDTLRTAWKAQREQNKK